MQPIVDGLETEFEEQVTVIRLNVAEETNAQLHQQYGLRGHPAFVVLDGDGHVTVQFLGPQTAETLREAMTFVQQE